MPAYVAIPFGIFFVCCALQFWFLRQVRRTLIERHPETFLEISKSAFFADQALWRFARSRRRKALQDPELDRCVRNLNLLGAVAILAWLAIMASMFLTAMH